MQNFNRMIASSPCSIDTFHSEHVCQINTICFNEPAVFYRLDRPSIFVEDLPLAICRAGRVEDLSDLLEASQCDVIEDDFG